MKRIIGNTQEQQDEPSERQIEIFNIYFINIGQILIEKLNDPRKNGTQKRALNSRFLLQPSKPKIYLQF